MAILYYWSVTFICSF